MITMEDAQYIIWSNTYLTNGRMQWCRLWVSTINKGRQKSMINVTILSYKSPQVQMILILPEAIVHLPATTLMSSYYDLYIWVSHDTGNINTSMSNGSISIIIIKQMFESIKNIFFHLFPTRKQWHGLHI